MLVKCPWCQGTFETDRAGVQPCRRCGAELDVPEASQPSAGAAPPPRSNDDGGPPSQGWPPPPPPPGGHDAPPPSGYGPPQGGHGAPPTGGYGPPQGGHGAPPPGGYGPPQGGYGGPPPGGFGPPRVATQLAPAPWEMRHQLGFFQALFETWKRATLHPTAFFSTLAPGPVGPAWGYAVLLSVPSAILIGIWLALFGGSNQAAGAHVGVLPLAVILAILTAVSVWINAAILHVCAMITGASSQGFDATFRTVAYSTGPTVFAWIPIVGSFAGLWVIVLEVIALENLQRTTRGRAIFAVLLPILVGLICACFALLTFATGAGMLMNAG